MCNVSGLEFFLETIKPNEFTAKKVLEVGSKYVNGSVRPLIENFLSPAKYIGIDISLGKMVDTILPAEKVLEYFGPESFDVVISSEMIEHVINWRIVIGGMKATLKRGGYIYLTTRSRGFAYHGFPFDFWRYEIDDMKKIFADFEIIKLQKDEVNPGVFLKAKKPEKYSPTDLSGIALYSMVLARRTESIVNIEDMSLLRKLGIRLRENARQIAIRTKIIS